MATGDSVLSIGSQGSVLSIGSIGSALSIGSIGSFASLGSIGSFASVLSIGSALSLVSVLSFRSRFASGAGRRSIVPVTLPFPLRLAPMVRRRTIRPNEQG